MDWSCVCSTSTLRRENTSSLRLEDARLRINTADGAHALHVGGAASIRTSLKVGCGHRMQLVWGGSPIASACGAAAPMVCGWRPSTSRPLRVDFPRHNLLDDLCCWCLLLDARPAKIKVLLAVPAVLALQSGANGCSKQSRADGSMFFVARIYPLSTWIQEEYRLLSFTNIFSLTMSNRQNISSP